MPKIFTYFGYMIYIFVDDHLPVHVHAMLRGRECKFILIYNNGLLTVLHENITGKIPLKSHEITEMRKFVRKYAEKIKEQWETIHYYKRKVVCINVRQKV